MKSTNKYVIYSVMVGNYGEIHQPLCIDNAFDYILFSDLIPEGKIGIWQVKRIFNYDGLDNKRFSRYPKAHPATLLSQYDASLYIDANIQIVDRWVYNRFLELVESNTLIAGIKLIATGRDCIYRHSYDMCVMKAEHDYNAIKQMHVLYKKGFPEHFGLNENNIIFRKHCDIVAKVDNEWWWWIKNYSYRDQFSYMYCLWKYSIPRVFFLPEGEEAGTSHHFTRFYHNSRPEVASIKWVKPTIFEAIRNKCRNYPNCYEKYCRQWVCLCKLPLPRISLYFWGIVVASTHLFRMVYLKYIKQI